MGSAPSKLSDAEAARLSRKCAARRTALAGCRAANQDTPQACERLEAALVMCYAAGAAQRGAEAGMRRRRPAAAAPSRASTLHLNLPNHVPS
jgi:hypothetical protein